MPLTNPVILGHAVSNTTQNTSTPLFLSAFSVAGAGIASVGMTNNSIVVSVPAGAPSPVNFSAGTTSNNLGSVVFSNSNGVSFGLNGSTITASAAGGAADGGVFAGVSTMGNTAGSTGTVSTGNFVLVGTNGIYLSQSTAAAGSHATVTVSTGPTQSMWAPYAVGQQGGGGAQGQATLHMMPVSAPFEVTFDRVGIYVSRSNASNSTGTITLSLWFGLYTRNVSTLSLYASASSTQGITFHGTVSSWTQHAGPRLATVGFSTSVSAGGYWAAVISRTTSGGAGGTFNQMLLSQFTANFSGVMGVGSNATAQEVLGKGVYTASTTGIPGSVAFSQINGTASLAMRAPIWVAMNGTA